MILLNVAARANFSYLASPPTHAAVSSRLLMYQQGSLAVVGITLNYWFGSLDTSGAFVVNPNTGTHVFTIPNPNLSGTIPASIITLVLTNLFGAGIAPSPTNPTVSVAVAGKLAGDHKIVDVDAIAAYLDPALAGVVV
ncbi:MAG: hypothetical protein NVSMB19_19820 [Vulcanimicrobiaceae bacterium]